MSLEKFSSSRSSFRLKKCAMHFFFAKNTVALINGHSKRRTPPINGQFSIPWPNTGQNLIEISLKSGQSNSGHISLHGMAFGTFVDSLVSLKHINCIFLTKLHLSFVYTIPRTQENPKKV